MTQKYVLPVIYVVSKKQAYTNIAIAKASY